MYGKILAEIKFDITDVDCVDTCKAIENMVENKLVCSIGTLKINIAMKNVFVIQF